MAKILLHIEYVVTNFHGWQKQPNNLPTIQAAIETAVEQIAGHSVEVIAAGRTDKGVHALNLTAHFETNAKRPISAWIFGVNTYLPQDISVINAQEVPSDFHASFDAQTRSYRYVLSNQPIRPSLLKDRVGWTFVPLNIELMQEATQYLLGEHDFSSFRSSECQANSPIKTMLLADVYPSNDLICFDFTATGFLHHMVRNIVGALVYLGSLKISMQQFVDIINAKDTKKAPPTFMADGLYFINVIYPEKYSIQTPKLPQWFWGK